MSRVYSRSNQEKLRFVLMRAKDECVEEDDAQVIPVLLQGQMVGPFSPAVLGGLTLNPGCPISQLAIPEVRPEHPQDHRGAWLQAKVPGSHFHGPASVSLGQDGGVCALRPTHPQSSQNALLTHYHQQRTVTCLGWHSFPVPL